MIRNFKRPIEPLIGTAGRVRKIGFSTRVSPKNERGHEGVTVINLSSRTKPAEFCLRVSKTRCRKRWQNRERKRSTAFSLETGWKIIPRLFSKPLEFSKLGRKIWKISSLFSTSFPSSHATFLFSYSRIVRSKGRSNIIGETSALIWIALFRTLYGNEKSCGVSSWIFLKIRTTR